MGRRHGHGVLTEMFGETVISIFRGIFQDDEPTEDGQLKKYFDFH